MDLRMATPTRRAPHLFLTKIWVAVKAYQTKNHKKISTWTDKSAALHRQHIKWRSRQLRKEIEEVERHKKKEKEEGHA